MASKRSLKKTIDYTIYDIVEESYSIQLYDPTKTELSDQIIDSADNLRTNLLSRISKARTKQEFREITNDLQQQAQQMYEKLKELQ